MTNVSTGVGINVNVLATTIALALVLAITPALALVVALVFPSPTLAAPAADRRPVGRVPPRCDAGPGRHETHLGHHTLGASTATAEAAADRERRVIQGVGWGAKIAMARARVSVTSPEVHRTVVASISYEYGTAVMCKTWPEIFCISHHSCFRFTGQSCLYVYA